MVASPVSIFVRIFCVLSAGLEHPLVIPYRNIAVNKGTSLHTHSIGNDMAFMLVYKNQFKDLYLLWSNICSQFYQPVKIVSF